MIIAAVSYADIKIAALEIDGPNYANELMAAIDGVLAADSTIDLILGPAEALGGDTNKARIYFRDSAGVIIPTADAFTRSWCIKSTIEGAQILAERYGTTIIPGTFWEIDENLRCYESIPIVGPDGNIQRVRRKAHMAVTDYAIDPTIKLDTIYTHDGSEYTYMIAISNETRDLWEVYSSLSAYNPDLLLVPAVHWSQNFFQIVNIIENGYLPDPAFLRTYINTWDGDMLDQLASHNSVIVFSCLDTLPGGVFAANFWDDYLPDLCWYGFDEIIETEYGNIYTFDPDEPVIYQQMHITIHALDTLDEPVESLFINFGAPGEIPTNSGWTNSDGIFNYITAEEESLFFLMAKDSCIVMPEETTVFVSNDNPACTVTVHVELDSIYGIAETDLPGELYLHTSPNPFNSAVSISAPAGAEVEIYDVNGRRIKTLWPFLWTQASATSLEKGGTEVPLHKGNLGGSIIWRPGDNIGSGIYLVRSVVGDGESTSKRVVYLK